MCGIFGIFGHSEAANLAYLGLHALQHRGQETAGISVSDLSELRTYRGGGLVVDIFDRQVLKRLFGRAAIGHVRYSTAGESGMVNAQPLTVRHGNGQMALAHNGNLVNAGSLRRHLEKQGSIFSTTSDSEVILHLLARARGNGLVDRLASALTHVKGAYSLVLLNERKLVAARDPHGFRPLVVGELIKRPTGASAWVFASETSAFDLIGARYVREVRPGEIVVADRQGLRSQTATGADTARFCVFEQIYFARPDSRIDSRSVYRSRELLGTQLAAEHPVKADIVIPVPDSGTPAALGFARASDIPFGMGLIRSHYVGRTFIEPEQRIRHLGVKLKLAPVEYLIAEKHVCVVDDSLVRGTTSRKIVEMLRSAGAKSVHFRISAPPTRHPCFYGIDTPSYDELIATQRSIDQIATFIGSDSLGFLSLEGMLAALGRTDTNHYCHACFSGDYPVPFERPRRSRVNMTGELNMATDRLREGNT